MNKAHIPLNVLRINCLYIIKALWQYPCSITKCLALELAPAIRVNAVAPGIISGSKYSSKTEEQRLLSRVPLKYEGNLLDVVGAVRYLLQAKYVTGQILAVDGGQSIA